MNLLRELTKVRGPVEPDTIITAPFREALQMSVRAIAVGLVSAAMRNLYGLISSGNDPIFYLIVACTVLAVMSLAFLYAYVGSVVGRRRASLIIKVPLALIVLSALIVAVIRTL